jgi:hypothetical protein
MVGAGGFIDFGSVGEAGGYVHAQYPEVEFHNWKMSNTAALNGVLKPNAHPQNPTFRPEMFSA